MNTTTAIKVQTTLKLKAEKVANELGVDLNELLKKFLLQLVRTKTILDISDIEIPNAHMKKMLKESKADIKAGRVISFKELKDSVKYVDELISHDRKNK